MAMAKYPLKPRGGVEIGCPGLEVAQGISVEHSHFHPSAANDPEGKLVSMMKTVLRQVALDFFKL